MRPTERYKALEIHPNIACVVVVGGTPFVDEVARSYGNERGIANALKIANALNSTDRAQGLETAIRQALTIARTGKLDRVVSHLTEILERKDAHLAE
jgi:hypothetical protein